MTTTLTIDGSAIHDIASFYDEINHVFMGGEDWTLGHSLDALADMLGGGYGAIRGREAVTLVWRDIAASRAALGLATTRAFLHAKLASKQFDATLIAQQLEALERGVGQTYFDIVMEVIAEHPNIVLVAA